MIIKLDEKIIFTGTLHTAFYTALWYCPYITIQFLKFGNKLFIEYATSAAHTKKYREMRKTHKTLQKKRTHINTIESKT